MHPLVLKAIATRFTARQQTKKNTLPGTNPTSITIKSTSPPGSKQNKCATGHALKFYNSPVDITARQILIKTTLPCTYYSSIIVKSTSSPVSKTKNTWISNIPSQISTKPIHRARCTIIKQHLEHQNTLYAQFARQVFLRKNNPTNNRNQIPIRITIHLPSQD